MGKRKCAKYIKGGTMNINAINKCDLYTAIREPVIKTRIKLKLGPDSDFVLAQIETDIWKNVCKVLDIKDV